MVLAVVGKNSFFQFRRLGLSGNSFLWLYRFSLSRNGFFRLHRFGLSRNSFFRIHRLGLSRNSFFQFHRLGLSRNSFFQFRRFGLSGNSFLWLCRFSLSRNGFFWLHRFSLSRNGFFWLHRFGLSGNSFFWFCRLGLSRNSFFWLCGLSLSRNSFFQLRGFSLSGNGFFLRLGFRLLLRAADFFFHPTDAPGIKPDGFFIVMLVFLQRLQLEPIVDVIIRNRIDFLFPVKKRMLFRFFSMFRALWNGWFIGGFHLQGVLCTAYNFVRSHWLRARVHAYAGVCLRRRRLFPDFVLCRVLIDGVAAAVRSSFLFHRNLLPFYFA